ncbi:MAG: hypothetical protein ILP19_04790 [Oscillospiraceae bacterium]|nr:hypothetical protein [Oscillospiraceae bacterium]
MSGITTSLPLPYSLIDIDGMGGEHFALVFKGFAEGQDERSIQRNGILGEFAVSYSCSGMQSSLDCDITLMHLYCFTYDLDTAWDINFNRSSTAVLEHYDPERTELIFRFDEAGKCFVKGSFRNKGDGYKSGISFDEFRTDLLYIPYILSSLGDFFDEMRRIQGHGNFM